jgi:lipid-binding SYLF domain-containing protein
MNLISLPGIGKPRQIYFHSVTILLMLLGLGSCSTLGGNGADSTNNSTDPVAIETVNTLIEKSMIVLEEIMQSPDNTIPASLLQVAEALIVVPDMFKIGFGIGANLGKGIAMVRQDDRTWSSPVMISMGGGSLGFQIGAQETDIVLVFKNRQGLENLVTGSMTLGADLGIAAGPIGVSTEAAADTQFNSEIYSYSRSKGLFAGVSLKGQKVEVDKSSNLSLYGKLVNAADIFANRVSSTSLNVVNNLKNKLRKLAP